MPDTDLRDFLHGRSPFFVAVAQFLRPEVARAGIERVITRRFARLVIDLAHDLPDSPELTAAVRKLVEARDGVVRAALLDLYTDED